MEEQEQVRFSDAFKIEVNVGAKGVDGVNGKSAFELWREKAGNENKSEEDFFNELKGDKGDSITFEDLTEQQINSLVDKVVERLQAGQVIPKVEHKEPPKEEIPEPAWKIKEVEEDKDNCKLHPDICD